MPQGFTPTKNQVLQHITARKTNNRSHSPSPPSSRAKFQNYFCHYNNALYMGGINAYKKHGKGILLHDNGQSILTEYHNDIPSGHNIIFRDNSLMSIIYKGSSEYEVVYRVNRYVIKLCFSRETQKVCDQGLLIDFLKENIYSLVYKNGVLKEKFEVCGEKDREAVFGKGDLDFLLGPEHADSINFRFYLPRGVKMVVEESGKKMTIGYIDKNNEINGIAFSMYVQNLSSRQSPPLKSSLYMKHIQKGNYKNSKMQQFGQQYFSNTNKYIGEYHNSEFQGKGILLNPSQLKWLYGNFQKNQLRQIIQSNTKKYNEKDFRVWNSKLKSIHKKFLQDWIDNDVEFVGETYVYKLMKDGLSKGAQKDIEGERIGNLEKIQANYTSSRVHPGFYEEDIDRYQNSKRNSSYQQEDIKDYPDLKQLSNIAHQYQIPASRSRTYQQPVNTSQQQQYRKQDPFKIQLIKVPSPNNSLIDSLTTYNYRMDKQKSLQTIVDQPLKRSLYDFYFNKYSSRNQNLDLKADQKYFSKNTNKIDEIKQSKIGNRQYQMYEPYYVGLLDRAREKQKDSAERRYLDEGKVSSRLVKNSSPLRASESPVIEVQNSKRSGLIKKRHFNYEDPIIRQEQVKRSRQIPRKSPSKYTYDYSEISPQNHIFKDNSPKNNRKMKDSSPYRSTAYQKYQTSKNYSFIKTNHQYSHL